MDKPNPVTRKSWMEEVEWCKGIVDWHVSSHNQVHSNNWKEHYKRDSLYACLWLWSCAPVEVCIHTHWVTAF